MATENDKLTAILIGGTGATGKEVLKELNATELISKIIFISRRTLEFPEQPKVRSIVLLEHFEKITIYKSHLTAHFKTIFGSKYSFH